jgi:hypothetical protein
MVQTFTERMMIADLLQQTDLRHNSLSEFQIVFSEFNTAKMKMVSQACVANYSGRTRHMVYECVLSIGLYGKKDNENIISQVYE